MVSSTKILIGFVFFSIVIIFYAASSSSPPEVVSLPEITIDEPTPVPKAISSEETSTTTRLKRNKNSNRSKNAFCILPVGDSLTQGVEFFKGYRAYLFKNATEFGSIENPRLK